MKRARQQATALAGVPPRPVVVRGLSKTYGRGAASVKALSGIDLTVEPGTFTAIMGPSGSGKSTLLNCLLGLERPDAGTIHLGGQEISGLGETELAVLRRSRIGVVFQAFNLMPALSAADNISLPLRLAGDSIDHQLVEELAMAVGVRETLARRPAELSGGQQQRVAIARALITRPELVVADEPTGSLDSASAEAVLALLRSIVDERGQQVLLVTHDPKAAAVADRVIFLADGRWQDEVSGGSASDIAARLARLGQRA
ncbi:ABC transporter ATP-binding protein [Kribbella deserti]|uniref:ABC transporter ATP-binding protein n=1 Tax=Kribbella deserti TaxID=1926257 RepID=A0ABV6QMP2_9ACTN